MNPPVSLYLDTRYKLDNGAFPLKVRVTFTKYVGNKKKWDQKYYPTGLSFTEAVYQKILQSKTKGSRADYKKMRALEQKARTILDQNPFISPELFSSLFTGEYTRTADLVQLYEERIKQFETADQHSSKDTYTYALESFKRFTSSSGYPLNLHAIDTDWLEAYEKWARKHGKVVVVEGGTRAQHKKESGPSSVTSIGIYLITLRAIFNLAITKKIVSPDAYPFGKAKYVIAKSNNFKKALPQDEKKKLLTYRPKLPKEAFYHAMWCLSYFCNGMNMIDIAYLRESSINDGVLMYIRKKTSTTKLLLVSLAKLGVSGYRIYNGIAPKPQNYLCFVGGQPFGF